MTDQLRMDDVCVQVCHVMFENYKLTSTIVWLHFKNAENKRGTRYLSLGVVHLMKIYCKFTATSNPYNLSCHVVLHPISPPSGSTLHRRKENIWIQFRLHWVKLKTDISETLQFIRALHQDHTVSAWVTIIIWHIFAIVLAVKKKKLKRTGCLRMNKKKIAVWISHTLVVFKLSSLTKKISITDDTITNDIILPLNDLLKPILWRHNRGMWQALLSDTSSHCH